MRQFKTIVICGILTMVALLTAWTPRARAAAAASDNATNDTMTIGANGGTGFAAWSNIQTNGGGSFFTGSSTNNSHHIAPGIDVGGKSWGLFANGTAVGTNYARMNRQFTAGSTPNVSLQPGQTFTVDMDNGLINTNGIIGFSLQNSSGNDVFAFKFVGGSISYQINGATPANSIGYTNAGVRVSVTLTSSTNYSCSVQRPNTGTAITNTGNLMNPTGGQSIDRLIYYTNGTGSGGNFDLFFNSMSISCPAPSFSTQPTNLSVCAGSSASFTVAATNTAVSPTYQWQKAGVTLTNSANVSGATSATLTINPVNSTNAASYSCVMTDVCGNTATSSNATLTVTTISLSPTTLPNVSISVPYNPTVSASGGTGPYTFSLTAGSLPTGLSLLSSGSITGTYNGVSGSATFTITATDQAGLGCSSNRAYTVQMVSCPTITASGNPGTGTVNTAYSDSSILAVGGAAPYTFTVSAGSLPPGLSLTSSNGVISGTPTSASPYNFTVLANDSNGCSGTTNLSIVIVCQLITVSINGAPSAAICVGTPVNLTAVGSNTVGTVTYSWTKDSTPFATTQGITDASAAGNHAYAVTVTDASGCSGSATPALVTVNSAPTITSQPSAESVCSNSTAVFTAATTGSPAYFWRKRGAGWGGGGWTLNGAGANGSFYVQSSTQNGNGDPGADGDIDTSGVAWGISAFNGAVLEAIRPLNANVQVGQTFNISMDNGFINGPSGTSSNSVGFNLRFGTTDRFVFVFRGGDSQYRIIDSSGNGVPTGIPFTDQGLHIAFTLTSTDTYSATISAVGTDGPNNLPVTITGTLEGTSGSLIDHVRFFNNNAGAGAANNAYFNSIGFGLRDDAASSYTSATWTNGSDFGNTPLINGATGAGSTIVGASTTSLTISNVGSADVASYDVWVTNSCGIAMSAPAALSIGQCGPYVSVSNTVGSSVIEARVYQNTGYVTLTGPDLNGNPGAVTLTFPPGSVNSGGNTYQIGPVLSSTPLSNGVQVVQSLGPTSIVVQVTFPYPGVMHYEVVNWGALPLTATCLTVPSSSGEHFYGFGEKFDALDQAGNKVHIMTHDSSARSVPDDTYAVAPWFISSLGYGFHLDSTDESWFDMRNQYPDRYVISNMVASSFSGYVTNAMKYNVVYGPNLTDVISRYTGYKGRPLLPPQWAFMPWMSDDIWTSGGEVRYVISRYRALGIPGSVFVFDSPWSLTYNDFIWSTNQFAAAGTFENVSGGGSSNYAGFVTIGDMLTFLRTNGFKVVVWFTPFINTTSWSENYANCLYNVTVSGPAAENYPAALASNYFVHAVSGTSTSILSVAWWKGTGSPVDFTNPNAVQWFQATLSNLVSQSGGVIGGFKTDDGEAQANPTPFIPSNALYYDGRTGVEMQNGYCVEYQKTVSAVLGTNGILWGRSGFAGSQTAPAIWGGDNEPNFGDGNGLPAVMLAGEGCAMSGFSIWGSDICGYEDSPWSSSTNNLFIRWAQFGAFSPIMQMHRQVGNCLMYPWRFSADALANYQFYTQLRASLLPYIYSYAAQASTSGLPILRPLVLMYPADPNTYGSVYNTSHSYLFGNEFLVAPVITANATSRAVYLPQGHWFDFFSNQRYTGGQTITWNNANQHQMPLFVREGAVIPMISTNVQTALDTTYSGNGNLIAPGNALQFLIYPTTNSSFSVYDSTSLQCQSNGTVIAATLNSVARPILLRFFTGQPFGVERDGVRLQSYTNATDFAAASLGWYYDAPSGFLQVKFNHAGGSSTIMFGPDSVGDGISDSWRAYYFGNGNATATNNQNCASCDPDGDGMTNAQEYHAGTSPINAASTLQLQNPGFQPVSGTNDFIIYWPTEIGIHYRVLWKNAMDNAVPWQTNTMDFIGDGTIFDWIDDGSVTGTPPGPPPTSNRFYKVIVP